MGEVKRPDFADPFEARELAVAVQSVGAREDGLAEGVASVWHHDRDPGPNRSAAHDQGTRRPR